MEIDTIYRERILFDSRSLLHACSSGSIKEPRFSIDAFVPATPPAYVAEQDRYAVVDYSREGSPLKQVQIVCFTTRVFDVFTRRVENLT
ncbi:hypothetical protein KAX14_01605 [Candidatus Bipolaricaulota bacterium]|nr:hypothetical protein [Candidatus Bipolaricaulota bacterium]